MHIDRRHSMYNVHYCVLCPLVSDSPAQLMHIDSRENQVYVHYFISLVLNMGHMAHQGPTIPFVWDT